MLTIAEELYLIALNEKRGKLFFSSSVSLAPALAGAILFDLAISRMIEIDGKKVIPIDLDNSHPKILVDCMMEIRDSKKNRSIKHWLRKFSSRKYDVVERVSDELVSRQLLEKEEKIYARYLSVFKTWLLNDTSKPQVVSKIQNAFRNERFDDSKVASLFITIVASGLEKLVFEKEEIGEVREAARWLQMDDHIAEALRDIVDEVTVMLCVAQNASSAA